MSITGGIKFFDENAVLLDNGGSIVASTGTAAQNYAIDKNLFNNWTSVGSNDATQETLTCTFPSATISRLLLLNHNFKNYTVKYWNGASFVDFASVLGLDPTGANQNGVSMSVISETVFADQASYYEFTPVTTTQLQIKINTTQHANDQKFLFTIFASTELGTLTGYPELKPDLTKNTKLMQVLSGLTRMVKQRQVFQATLSFANYPVQTAAEGVSFTADLDLMWTLFDRETPFHIFPCGARRGTKPFRYASRSWRVFDLFRVQVDSALSPLFLRGIYLNPVSMDVTLIEHT